MDPWDDEPTTPPDDAMEPTRPLHAPDPTWEAGEDTDEDVEDDEGVDQMFDGSTRGHGLRNALIIVLVLAIVVGLGVLGYTKGRQWINSFGVADYPGPGDTAVQVTIPSGAASRTMAAILQQADVVASTQAFLNAVNADMSTYNKIYPGVHNMKTKMSGVQALAALADPKNLVQNTFTIPEGTRNTTAFATINSKTGVAVADLQALAAAPTGLGLPVWAVNADSTDQPEGFDDQLEGYLFPDTYSFDPQPTAASVLTPMVSQFNQVISSLDFVDKAQAEGLTPQQAVVLASLIQAEAYIPADATSDNSDAADIAQVILNRMAQGMPLQLDSTVSYANNVSGSINLTNDQMNIDSPYNTYANKGLPPGAICNPGKVALEAAVNPSEGTYLYFVTVNLDTHETKFASTLDEHNQYVAELTAWCNANPGRC